MDEFDIYLESTGSMQTYQNNKLACFRNVLSEPLQLDGDRRVALEEITFPSSIKNVTMGNTSFIHLARQKKFCLISTAQPLQV